MISLKERFEYMVENKTCLYQEHFSPYIKRIEDRIGDCDFNSLLNFAAANKHYKSNELGVLDEEGIVLHVIMDLFKRLKYGEKKNSPKV